MYEIDEEKLLFRAAAAFHAATTHEEIEAAWAEHVKPIHNHISEDTLTILTRIYNVNMKLLRQR